MDLSVDRATTARRRLPRRHSRRADQGLGLGARLPRARTRSAACAGMPRTATRCPGLAVGVHGPVIANSQQLVGLSLPGFGVALNALASAATPTSSRRRTSSRPTTSRPRSTSARTSRCRPERSAALGGLGGLGALGGSAARPAAPRGALGALGGLGGLGGFGGAAAPGRRHEASRSRRTSTRPTRCASRSQRRSRRPARRNGGASASSRSTARAPRPQLVVRDQQTVVIGGLMRDQVTTRRDEGPGPRRHPGARRAVPQQHQAQDQEEPAAVPHAVHHPRPDDLRAIFERKMQERQEFLDRYFVFSDPRVRAAERLLAHERPGRRDHATS